MKTYNSKISIGLVIFLIALFSFIGYEIFSDSFNFLAILIFIVPILFITYVFTSIKYTIENRIINIKAGFLINENIEISKIKRIEETNNIISSPAASFDRLEIFYNKFDSIIISPSNKSEFISDLTKINPDIEVKYKKS
jgi:hypothetical protein